MCGFFSPECVAVVDIVFMIDSSQSMQNKEFEDTKAFISKVIPHLNPSSKGTDHKTAYDILACFVIQEQFESKLSKIEN